MGDKPVFRVGVAGLDARALRLIDIVFRHSGYNRYEFRLADAGLVDEIDLLIANATASQGQRAISAARELGRPIIAAFPRGATGGTGGIAATSGNDATGLVAAPGDDGHSISIERLTLQLLPVLNQVVEAELLAAAPSTREVAPAPQDETKEEPATIPEPPGEPEWTPPESSRAEPAQVEGTHTEPAYVDDAHAEDARVEYTHAGNTHAEETQVEPTHAEAERAEETSTEQTPEQTPEETHEEAHEETHEETQEEAHEEAHEETHESLHEDDDEPAAPVRSEDTAGTIPSSGERQSPADATVAAHPSNLVAFPAGEGTTTPRLRVLVVDDSPTVRRQLTVAFDRLGLGCETVDSAVLALERLEQRHFDLALIDVVMPDCDGYKLTREIKRNRQLRHMPVIILTSRSSPFDLARGALSGCDAYLTKPVPFRALESAVVKQLRRSLAQDDLSGLMRLSDAEAVRPETRAESRVARLFRR